MLGDSIKEVQQVTSTGAPLAITGLDFRGSGCGYNISMKLPSTAKGRWGLNFRLLGGPGNISDYTTTLSPRVAMSAAGCTVGKGAPSSCTVQLVAPQGYAQDPAFASNTVIIDFFTSVSVYYMHQVHDKLENVR